VTQTISSYDISKTNNNSIVFKCSVFSLVELRKHGEGYLITITRTDIHNRRAAKFCNRTKFFDFIMIPIYLWRIASSPSTIAFQIIYYWIFVASINVKSPRSKLIEEYQTHQLGAKLFANAGFGIFANQHFDSNYQVAECITGEGRRIHKLMEQMGCSDPYTFKIVFGIQGY
jgi:hypothetical protein